MRDVPRATIVITNPTHFAVALRYERGMNAPVCVAKGVDLIARKIREIAEKHDIPVVGVYETMPTPGYDYQSWMTAEVKALADALAHGVSAPRL